MNKSHDVPRLQRLGPASPAGLWFCSLPVPRSGLPNLHLSNRATWRRALGQWPEVAPATPRRFLLACASDGNAPEQLDFSDTCSENLTGEPPIATARLLQRSDDPTFVWQRDFLHLDYRGRTIGLALGLRTGSHVHWWEACRLITQRESATCREIEMGGAIPLQLNGREHIRNFPSLRHPFLHKHNWLYGRLTARLHHNGVCEIFAHHINSRFVDEGGDLSPAVPVIGFIGVSESEANALLGDWTGAAAQFRVGHAVIDATDAAPLATAQQPGKFFLAAPGQLAWQPYQACELYGGACPRQRTGDAHILRAESETILRGMARTVRFSLSLSDASPRVARYVAPGWWYGLCEELTPAAQLPVHGDLSQSLNAGWQWISEHSQHGGFEDGSIGRYMPAGRARPEPGWEGELPYAMFLSAWRSGDEKQYEMAMRSAYHVTDIGVDHAGKLMRMHGYPPIAFSLPMNRMQGSLAAFLETGDDYLLDTAEAVVESAFRVHQNAWPRDGVGRDACFVRSALLLYRYFSNGHFLRIARAGIDSVVQSQREDGSFGDQGGGSGIHQFSAHMTKPWMALLAVAGVLDHLELIGDDPAMLSCVRRLADWLLENRVTENGVPTWRYLHDYAGQGQFYTDDGEPIPCPMREPWHQETLARLLGYCTLKFGEPAYLLAWHASRPMAAALEGDHPIAAAMQWLPWLESKLCGATWDAARGEVKIKTHGLAHVLGHRVTVDAPSGPVEVELKTSEPLLQAGVRP